MRAVFLTLAVLAQCGSAEPDITPAHDPATDGLLPLCGTQDVLGTPHGPVKGAQPGCGIAEAVRVERIAGVRLSTPALMDCTTARTLADWMTTTLRPAGQTHGGVTEIKVAAHYVCRPINHRAGAKLSEHSKGRAIDISAFRFNDGTEVTVEKGWGAAKDGAFLRRLHKGACEKFGTVLGPEADSYHRDHFHFDTKPRRNGAYCR